MRKLLLSILVIAIASIFPPYRIEIKEDRTVAESFEFEERIIFKKKAIVITPEMYDIIKCESQWNNEAIGKAGEIGLAQFKKETFEWMSGLAEFEGNIYSAYDQLWLLKWALENGYGNHWTCYRKLVSPFRAFYK